MVNLENLLKQQNSLEFPPLKIEQIESDVPSFNSVFQIQWGGKSKLFVADMFSTPTPKNIKNKIYSSKKFNLPKYFPLLVTTYLSEENLQRLISAEISGIDLCGNGVVIADNWFVYRSGAKNKFPSNAPIKNIYRGTSSIIASVFLLKSEFQTVGDILSEVEIRGGKTTLATVSKVLKVLEEELIISRNQSIKLINPNKLLEELTANYRIEIVEKCIGKTVDLPKTLAQMRENSETNNVKFVCLDSSKYAISAASSPMLKIYTESIENLLNDVEFEETNRFANLEICQTYNQTVYFDSRENTASPIQVYLEFAKSGKREQTIAESIKQSILRGEI